MTSTNKTTNIKLSQFEGSDSFTRESYNSDMLKIDTEVGRLSGEVVSLNSSTALDASHEYKYIRITLDSALDITIPNDATFEFPLYTEIAFRQTTENGVAKLVAGNGVTLNSKDDKLTLDGKNASAAIKKIAPNEWDVAGLLV